MRFFSKPIIYILFSVAFLTSWVSLVFAATTTTTSISQIISSGSLTVIAQNSTATLTTVTVDTSTITATGVLSGINVDDKRGTGVGWSLSMNVQHLTTTRDPLAASGNTGPLIIISPGSSRYDGSCLIKYPPVSYTVRIASGGSVGGATYDVTGGCTGEATQSNVTTQPSNDNVGSRGVKVNFPSGTYGTGDNWFIGVDVYPYTGMYVTPQNPTASEANSDLDGVTAAAVATLAGTGLESNSKTLLSAANGKGLGSYLQDVTLRQEVHGHNYSGVYQGTITLTIVSN